MNKVILMGYIPGAIGRIAELHATYYQRYWGFGLFFEAKVAMELSSFSVDLTRHVTAFGPSASTIGLKGVLQSMGSRPRWMARTFGGRSSRRRCRAVVWQSTDGGSHLLLQREKLQPGLSLDFRRTSCSSHLYEKFGFKL